MKGNHVSIIFLGLVVLCLTFTHCNNEENGFIVGSGVGICLVDQHGKDLFNPNTPKGIDTSAIKIYNIIDGRPILYYNYQMDYNKGYWFKKYDSIENLVMHFYTSPDSDKSSKSTTIIKWSELESDTIIIQTERNSNSIYVVNHWINGKEDKNMITGKYIDRYVTRIIKER